MVAVSGEEQFLLGKVPYISVTISLKFVTKHGTKKLVWVITQYNLCNKWKYHFMEK